jgi:hypothetical protein
VALAGRGAGAEGRKPRVVDRQVTTGYIRDITTRVRRRPNVKDLIPLPKMLAQLRSDLLEAKAEGEGQDLHFLVDDIELELQMATTQEEEGGVGVKFWVLNANAKGTSGGTATQTLKLRLKAQGHEGAFEVSRSRGKPR